MKYKFDNYGRGSKAPTMPAQVNQDQAVSEEEEHDEGVHGERGGQL